MVEQSGPCNLLLITAAQGLPPLSRRTPATFTFYDAVHLDHRKNRKKICIPHATLPRSQAYGEMKCSQRTYDLSFVLLNGGRLLGPAACPATGTVSAESIRNLKQAVSAQFLLQIVS